MEVRFINSKVVKFQNTSQRGKVVAMAEENYCLHTLLA